MHVLLVGLNRCPVGNLGPASGLKLDLLLDVLGSLQSHSRHKAKKYTHPQSSSPRFRPLTISVCVENVFHACPCRKGSYNIIVVTFMMQNLLNLHFSSPCICAVTRCANFYRGHLGVIRAYRGQSECIINTL